MNTESLVVIRTFDNLLDADVAQIELLNAGIYSLLFSDEASPSNGGTPAGDPIALAVHRRDAEVAFAVVAPVAQTA